MSTIVVLIIAVLAVILAIGLAYVPLRLLLAHIARNVREFIERQRERRSVTRATTDRRKV
jgi:predicted Holliday junction resolvase-like endonuclease